MTEGNGKVRVNILDLPLRTIAAIEKEVGYPTSRWSEVPSLADLLVTVYAHATDTPRDTVEGMSLRELQESVDLSGDESPGDPT